MTPHTPLSRENAHELTWGDEGIFSSAPSSSPAIRRCPGPNAAPVGLHHKPCPAQGLCTQPGSTRKQPPLGGKGREGCSALPGQSSFCRGNRGKNGENYPYVFSSSKASVTQMLAVGFQKKKGSFLQSRSADLPLSNSVGWGFKARAGRCSSAEPQSKAGGLKQLITSSQKVL